MARAETPEIEPLEAAKEGRAARRLATTESLPGASHGDGSPLDPRCNACSCGIDGASIHFHCRRLRQLPEVVRGGAYHDELKLVLP